MNQRATAWETMKPSKRVAFARLTLFASFAIAGPLSAQQPAGITRQSHRDGHAVALSPSTDQLVLDVASALRSARADSNKDESRRLKYAGVGAALGALVGAVLGHQYAQAHKPACVNVPAGPPCRYLDPDNSSSYLAAGIGLGTGLGLLIGVLLSR